MSTTISDIAKLAGTNRSTVSRVLNDSPNFSAGAECRKRIISIARKLKYQPRYSAKSLASGKTYCVGVILGTLENDLCSPYFASTLAEMNRTLLENGYTLTLLPINQGKVYDDEVLSTIRRHRCDGYFIGTDMAGSKTMNELSRQKIPLAIHQASSGIVKSGLCNAAELDLRMAMESLAKEFARCSHQRVAYFVPEFFVNDERLAERLTQLQSALQRQGIDMRDNDIITYRPSAIGCLFDRVEAMHAALLHVDALKLHTAVAACSDLVALGMCDALRMRGIEPGKDIGIVGYDNIEESPNFPTKEPFLTTIDPDNRRMGRVIAEMLLDRIRNPTSTPATRSIPARLIIRKSLGEPVNKSN